MKIILIAVAPLFLALTAGAETPSPAEEENPDSLVDCYVIDQAHQSAVTEISAQTNDVDLRGFALYAAHAWKADRLNVTFASDTAKPVKEGVAKIMTQWNEFSRVKFYASDLPFEKGDIRVAFKVGYGNNSQIGRLASRLSTNTPTMNLETCVKW